MNASTRCSSPARPSDRRDRPQIDELDDTIRELRASAD
jgi:hypothetical protein